MLCAVEPVELIHDRSLDPLELAFHGLYINWRIIVVSDMARGR